MAQFTGMLGQVTAGDTAVTQVVYLLPPTVALQSPSVSFDLIDADGVVYGAGFGTNLQFVSASGGNNRLSADISVSIPSDLPANVAGTSYQVRVKLTISGQELLQFLPVVVLPYEKVQLGAESAIEFYGDAVEINLVLPSAPATNPTLEVYNGNTALAAPVLSTGPVATADGYRYTVSVATAGVLPPTFVQYTGLWRYGNNQKEVSKIYVVTASMLQAMNDIRDVVNKARAHFGFQPVFSPEQIAGYLRMGMDKFNGWYFTTNFNMTNATGPVRAFWLALAQIEALRSQYLMEGVSAFDFGGQAVTLTVDQTQYYEGLASAIENQITEPLRQFKNQIATRGLTSGDGNVDPNSLAFGAVAHVGIGLSPVSNIRPGNANGMTTWRFLW